MPGYVEAPLRYSIDTGVKPVTANAGPGGRAYERSGGRDDDRVVAIHDTRPRAAALSIDREGFELVTAPTTMSDFWDPDERARVYDPEIEALVARVSGAKRVVVFDHTLRSGSASVREVKPAREPVQVVHNDYTDRSGPQRLRDILPDEAEALLRNRFAVIQVWRPFGGPVEANPLTVCDATTVADHDLIAAERRHENRVGEIYQLAFNPDHRWCYFPRMRPDEALVFKVYDSARDGRARFTPHTSFDDPTTTASSRPRESIEVRTLALF